PPSRPGPRLPVRRLRPRLQRLHRLAPGRDAAAAVAAPAHLPRRGAGRPHGPDGPRAGLRPQAPPGVEAPPPGARPARAGPQPAGRRRGRGRRVLRQRGGKNLCRQSSLEAVGGIGYSTSDPIALEDELWPDGLPEHGPTPRPTSRRWRPTAPP